MANENGKERCKACYPCPMGVVGCGEDNIPHGHGSSQRCPECDVPYAYIHPHSNFCSRGTPINTEVVHDDYHLKMQLKWQKMGININVREAEKENLDKGIVEKMDKGINNGHQFLALKLIPKGRVTVGKNQSHTKLNTSNHADVEELQRFALMTINNRIEFCQKYKKTEEDIGKCVCESLVRYIRLSKEARTKTITRAQINAIKKMFEEMKKEGKIKSQNFII